MCRRYGCEGNKLREASEQQQFNRNIEDVDIWLHEIESQLASEDYGKVSGGPIVSLTNPPSARCVVCSLCMTCQIDYKVDVDASMPQVYRAVLSCSLCMTCQIKLHRCWRKHMASVLCAVTRCLCVLPGLDERAEPAEEARAAGE